MYKHYLTLALLAVLAITIVACGGGAAPTSAPQQPGATTAPQQPAATTAPQQPAATTAAVEAPKALDIVKWDYPPTKCNNVTLTVVGDAGHNLKPWEFWKDEFTKAGITIKIIEVPFEGVYEKEKTEFVAGSGAFDIVTFYPSYMGDFAGNGYLEPLDDYMKKEPAAAYDPHQDDVMPPFRELYNKWGGKTYGLTIDGDALMFIYRKDLFNNADEQAAFKAKYNKDLKPPETWDDWLQVGQFFTRKKGDKLAGQTLDKDFYGSADLMKRGFSYAWFLNRWVALGQLYFDANMKPQINTPEAVKGLQNEIDSLKNSPPDVLSYGYDELRDALLKGNVAMIVQWTDVPKKGYSPTDSVVAGKLGQGTVPGLLVDGKVVHRGMMPVGRVLAISASSKNKECAYWAIKHFAYDRSTENVSTTLTGLDPYRKTNFDHPEAFSMFPDATAAGEYLKGVSEALADGYPDILIPGAAQYQDALDLHVNKALAGEETAQAALDAAAKEWDAITDKLGRDKQKTFWAASVESLKALGYTK